MSVTPAEFVCYINELEGCIRNVAATELLQPKRYEGPMDSGTPLKLWPMMEHALWLLGSAKTIAEAGQVEGVWGPLAAASALMMPFGIGLHFNMPGAGPVYPAMIVPGLLV